MPDYNWRTWAGESKRTARWRYLALQKAILRLESKVDKLLCPPSPVSIRWDGFKKYIQEQVPVVSSRLLTALEQSGIDSEDRLYASGSRAEMLSRRNFAVKSARRLSKLAQEFFARPLWGKGH
jgi:hypothetical protein